MSTKLTTPNATKQTSESHQLSLVGMNDLAYLAGFILGFLDGKSGGILDLYEPEEYLYELQYNPNMQLWMAHDKGRIEGLMATAFVHFPKRKVLHVTAVNAVKFRKYMKTFDRVERWAYDNGCTEVMFDGPEAWTRLWIDNGFKKSAVRFTKSLTKVWGH
jgi:hypothetical protein